MVLFLEYTEILKIVNTSFGNLPRSGLLEQAAAVDRRPATPSAGGPSATELRVRHCKH